MSLTSLEPESSASANSAISANHEYYYSIAIRICQHLFSNFFRKIICIHCFGEFFVQGFDHSEASVEFRIGFAFRAPVTDTVSGEFGYASAQGPMCAKRYGNPLEFAQPDKILAGDVFPSEEPGPCQP